MVVFLVARIRGLSAAYRGRTWTILPNVVKVTPLPLDATAITLLSILSCISLHLCADEQLCTGYIA